MRPGDIFWVEYPATGGTEQAGRRPGLILQDDGFAGRSPLVLTVPLTTAASTVRFPAVVPVPVTDTNGLAADSFALVFQLRATDRGRFGKKVGVVDPAILTAILAALDQLTGRAAVNTGS